MKILTRFTAAFAVCLLSAGCGIAPRAESPPGRLTVYADYDLAVGPLEKARVLNGSVGGYGPMSNLNWLPDAYDSLAAIGFRMIRLDHLINDKFYRAVARDGAGKLTFDFSRLDRIIRPMLDRRMTPLMCLTYCPGVLIPEGGDNGSPPKSLDEWKHIVTAYVRHYRDLGFTGWYWEVWNEPDIDRFFRGSGRQYVELYVKTAEGVKEADPTAKIGGAADASVRNSTSRLKDLLDHVRRNPSVPLDFISYHKYGGSALEEKPPFDLKWNVDAVSAQLASRGLPPREIFVTEWNLTPVMDAGPGADTDTNRGAAGVAARMSLALQQPALTKVFFFSPIEGYRPDSIFNGDLGLLTVNYHKKAVYNVFKMFAGLGDILIKTRISSAVADGGATSVLATKEAAGGKTAVLLWNYGEQAVPVQLTVDHLPYRSSRTNVRFTRYQVDADQANYYKDYRAGLRGCKTGPSEDLEPVEIRVVAPASRFDRAITLPPFSVAEIILEPAGAGVFRGVLDDRPRVKRELNLAAAKTVTAGSSLDAAGWGAARLVDEITHSLPGTLGWSSAGSETPDRGEWVCVDLGRVEAIDTVILYPRDDQEAEGGGFPVDFKIQASLDLENWTDLAVRTGYLVARKAPGAQTFRFAGRRGRFVRVYATRLGRVSEAVRDYCFQLAELEVYGRNE